jgi:hypothetical protein
VNLEKQKSLKEDFGEVVTVVTASPGETRRGTKARAYSALYLSVTLYFIILCGSGCDPSLLPRNQNV